MSLWFLLPTATCVTAALLSSRWKDEPSLICAGLAILSFPVALILAPWEVQVLLLLSIVLVARYGVRSTESLEESVDGSLEESTASGMAGVLDRETADRPNFVGAWRSRLGWSDSHSSDQARAATGTVAPPPPRSTDSVSMADDGDLAATGDRIYRGVTWHQSDLNPDAPPSVPGTIKLKYRGTTVERKL